MTPLPLRMMTPPRRLILGSSRLASQLGQVPPTTVIPWEHDLGVPLSAPSHRMSQGMVLARRAGTRDLPCAGVRALAAVSLHGRRAGAATAR
jgi:hypothetical protein